MSRTGSASRFGLLAACLGLALLVGAGVRAQVRVPATAADWKALSSTLADLYRDRDYSRVAEMEPSLRSTLLAGTNRQYLPTIYLALALQRQGRDEEALPYFEKALTLHFKAENLRHYAEAATEARRAERGVQFARSLRTSYPDQATTIDAEAATLTFFSLVERGDEKYLRGDRKGALPLYQEAQRQFERVPVDPERQAEFIAQHRRVWDEYTYYHAYDTPDGYKRRELLLGSFLLPKIRLCGEAPVSPGEPVRFRLAALVVRNTDLDYADGEKKLHEKKRLTDTELFRVKDAWQFAVDALTLYSSGRMKVETTYVELPGVTLTGLTERVSRGIHVRHLDPARLTPPQDDLYARLVPQYDGFVFIWPRGAAARAYGGGALALPAHGKDLPYRAGVKCLPSSPALCLHEFMHNFVRRLGTDPVHGPATPWAETARKDHLSDEVDWYLHLVSSVKDWSRAPFRSGGGPAEEKPAD